MQWNDEIVMLWATPIMRRQIEDPSVLGRLAELGAGPPAKGADTFFTDEDAAIQLLRESIVKAVQAYFEHLEVRSAPGYRLRGRFERLTYGESRALRNATGTYLTGIFCIEVPKDAEPLHLRLDARPGHVTLYDPRPRFNMLSIKNDPYRNQSLTVECQSGLFVMWPASVSHYCHPNLSRNPQLCIVFDVIPSDGDTEEDQSGERWEGDIHDAWPTLLVKRRLPAYEQPNRELIGAIDELERENPNLTTDFNLNRFRSYKPSALEWLLSNINRCLAGYFKQLGMDYPISWNIALWPNINRFGDYHSPHNHPWCYLSGTYYVQVPEPDAAQGGSHELNSGCISFYDPRSESNNLESLPPASPAARVYTIRPVPGALLMWPSSVYHFVHPNLSTTKRYSISFNVHLQMQDHYL